MKLTRWIATGLAMVALFSFSSCYQSKEVKIGVIIPQEGEFLQDYGYQITSGIKLALEQLQASGGLKKNYTLSIKSENESDPEAVLRAFNELKEEGVTAIIGPASSASTLALTDVVNESKIVLLSPAASSPEINTSPVPNFVFRNQPSDTLEAQLLSNVIFQKCRIKKVMVLRSRDAYSEGISFEFLKFGRQDPQHKIPGEVIKFDSDPSKVDWVSVVDRLAEFDLEAVFLGAYKQFVIPLIKEIRSREDLNKVYIFTSSSFLPDEAIANLGEDVVEGVMFTNYPWDPNKDGKPNIQDFVTTFSERHHAVPNVYAANGYDSMMILCAAIDNVDHWVSDAVRDELNKMEFTDKTTSAPHILRTTDFNKRGDVTRIPSVYVIREGTVSKMQPEDFAVIREYILTQL